MHAYQVHAHGRVVMASDKFTSSFKGDLTEIERDYQQGRHIYDMFTYLTIYRFSYKERLQEKEA